MDDGKVSPDLLLLEKLSCTQHTKNISEAFKKKNLLEHLTQSDNYQPAPNRLIISFVFENGQGWKCR